MIDLGASLSKPQSPANGSKVDQLKAVLSHPKTVVSGLRRKSGGEVAGPCPKCGGDDRFYVRQDGSFGCRKCNPKGGDTIDFYQWYHGTDLKGLAGMYLDGQQPAPATPRREKARAIQSNLTAIYDYVDEDGTQLFQVRRYEEEGCEKTFRQYRKVGNRYIPGVTGVKRVIYCLPDILKADYVIWVEGEKDADNLVKHGFKATTSPMGANNYQEDYAHFLKEKHVAIIADNDNPGREYAQKVADSLQWVAASVRIVELPGLPLKGDVSDWFDMGGTKKGLLALIEQAPEVKPVDKPKFQWENLADLQNKEFPVIKWIVPGYLAEGTTILGAKPKIGKSTLAANIGLAVAMGGKALGSIDVECGTVFYISLDDASDRRLQGRVKKMLPAGTKWPATFKYTTSFPNIDNGGLELLEQSIKDNPDTRVVIIDTMHKFLSSKRQVSKNAYESDTDRLAPIARLATKLGVCILLIHHLTKASYDDVFDSLSGSIGVQGGVDDLMVIERDELGFKLSTRGRTLDEKEVILGRDATTYTWTIKGDASSFVVGDQKQAVLDTLRQNGDYMTAKEIGILSGVNGRTLSRSLSSLVKTGHASKGGRGKYIYNKNDVHNVPSVLNDPNVPNVPNEDIRPDWAV